LLTGALMVALFLPETREANSSSDDDDDDLMAITAVFRDRRLAALLMPVAVIEISASWVEAVLPLYATGAGTLTPSGVGLLFTMQRCSALSFSCRWCKPSPACRPSRS
jgi:hypothetical protein